MIRSKSNTIYRFGFSILLILFFTLLFVEIVGVEVVKEEVAGIASIFVFEGDLEEIEGPFFPAYIEEVESDGFAFLVEKYEDWLPYSFQKYRANKRISLGAYFPSLSPDTFYQVLEHEELIGHKVRYLLLHRAWGDGDKDFPVDLIPYFKASDIIPVITWEPWARDFADPDIKQEAYSLESIANGQHDEYIREWAKDAKEADIYVILRFAHEQSTPEGYAYWYPWQGDSKNYVSAYRRIVNIFRAEGADKVRFMWSPVAFWSAYEPSAYYPGDDYTDLIGITVLNHGTRTDEESSTWRSCHLQYEKPLAKINTHDLPLMIAEFGSAEDGGDKGDWYRDCLDIIDDNNDVIGLISLENPIDTSYEIVDWRSTSSAGAIAGFLDGINSGSYR